MSDSIYERVTAIILEQLTTADPASWTCPWHRPGGGLPINAFTGRTYRGINVLTCWAAARSQDYSNDSWASFRQWSQLGAQVRRGEKGTPCVFFKSLDDSRDGNACGYPTLKSVHSADGSTVDRRFVLRYSTIFNAAQVEGAPASISSAAAAPRRLDPTPVFDPFVASTGAVIVPGSHASYVPALDLIHMPPREIFKSPAGYAATLGHEIVHWTGSKHRLDRQLQNRFGSKAYAVEELVAELGAAFVLAELNLASAPHPDHANYIANWLPVVKSDPRALFTAAAHAARAADFLAATSHNPAVV